GSPRAGRRAGGRPPLGYWGRGSGRSRRGRSAERAGARPALAQPAVAACSAAAEHEGVDVPETRYAKAPDGTSIAYQVVGDGPVDLVYANGIWSNVDLMWDLPPW